MTSASTSATTEKSSLDTPYHNITISLNSPDVMKEVIKLTIAVKPSWNGKMLKAVQTIRGTCISNTLVACYYGENMSTETSVLVRINGIGTEKIINRDNEINTLITVSSVGSMNSAKLLAVFANGICYEYTEGDILDVQTVRDPHIAKLIAVEMARMHFIAKHFQLPRLPHTDQLSRN